MTTATRYALIIGVIVALGLAALTLNYYSHQPEERQEQERVGTEKLDAADVVDLEVQAEADYKASGGNY